MSPRGKAILVAGLPLILLTPPLVWLGSSFARDLAQEERIRTRQTLELHAGALQRSIDRIEGKLESLKAFVAGQTAGGRAIDDEQFRTFAAGLHASAAWIRAFQLVRDGVITHTYPLKGNEVVLGYNLLTDPRPIHAADVLRAERTGRITITGPLDLVQGGLGIIVRQPLPRVADGPSLLVAVVLNIDPLLADAGIGKAGVEGSQFAIRRDSGEVFFGPPQVFADYPVTRRLALPDGWWEMGARPRAGWAAALDRPVLRFYLTGAAIIFLLGLLVYVLAASRGLLTETVRERTAALRRELSARQQAEDEVRQNLALLQAVTEGTSDAVFVKDRRGCYRMINSAGAAFLGRTPDAILGRDDREMFSEDTARTILDDDRQVMESGRVQTMEERGTAAGVTRIYQATKAPWRDAHGAIIGVVGVSRDITERKQAEEALRESEARYRELFENNPAPMLIYDRATLQLLAVNEAFEGHYGYSRAEALALRLPDLYPAKDKAAIVAIVPKLQGYAYVGEWHHLKRDGSEIAIVARSHDIVYSGRTCRIAVISDITERKQAEEARKASEAQVRALLVAADCLLWQAHVTRSASGETAWKYYIPRSGLYRRLYGMDPGESPALHWDDLGVPELPKMHARCQEALTANAPGYVNEFHAFVGGQAIWLHEQVAVTRETESSWQLVGVITDVTESKRAEEALRESRRQFQTLAEVSPVGIFQTNARGETTYVNPRWCEIAGLPAAEAMGEGWLRAVHPEDQGKLARGWHTATEAQGASAAEYRFVRPDGTEAWVMGQAVPEKDEAGGIVGYVGTIIDVTEQKRAEEEIRKFTAELEQRVAERTAELAVARDRAEAADRLKSSFLATMSHELRTPLNSIIGFTGIILQGLAGPLHPEQHKQLEMVRGSARHLLALINDVLDISKIEAGQLVIAREPFDLRHSIERVGGSIRPLAEGKGLALRLDLPSEIPPWQGDQRRFEQVLLNLLNNAVKFTERGEVSLTVTLAASAADLPAPAAVVHGSTAPFATDTPGPLVRLAVRDTGIGIKPKHLAILFRPFQQIDTGLTRQHEGTGLGLAICRRLATLMGGAIEVESEWGKGSVFTVTLPFDVPAPAPAAAGTDHPPSTQDGHPASS